jgi:hypothetical protein
VTSLNEPKNVASIKLLSEYISGNIVSMSQGKGCVKQIPH